MIEDKNMTIDWVKVDFYCERGNDVLRCQGNPLKNVPRTIKDIKKALKQWSCEFTGKGKITINWIECGPFRADFLSDEQSEVFEGMVIKFDN